MKAVISIENLASSFVVTIWTPLFVGIFMAIVVYALWPRNKRRFDSAARMPLRRD
ncbi:cbb3-type cytochrome c oxidase subunit 3 [Bradyrhizobium sp. Pear77]|uniref:cbb3-type cytochrome c oxidase subunit 3 n=1 Tax=Bradyrhizobium TaxID=374 RepID=UPI001E622080|nr:MULTISPECIES: cbb3-type cytochrome c oxidase subunit 3 [Bradyrhizobium]MCC8955446.1 cbb3-type cytochrome c oxidase subunit 3 [Bradyrhizobium altum]MCC8965236.1 cbb3-type cytochrome c oxidase subunit 3 [Bradyrhizobium oropedii]